MTVGIKNSEVFKVFERNVKGVENASGRFGAADGQNKSPSGRDA